MFQIIWSCISQFWELLRESMSSTNNSQTPSSSPSDSMPRITTCQAPSSSVSDLVPCTTISQTPSSSTSESMASTTISQTHSTFVCTSTPTKYDVFLSFRGTDTRHTFTGHLHNMLVRSGIKTFMDDPELHSGEVISDALLDAIRESKTYIVVLSQNYASSGWCLDELVEIFNCRKTAERLVIPVFYKIDPAVVRHQIGSFKKAFKKHQVRVEMEKVNNWRLTLTRVADFSGFHIYENTSEADVINEIVDILLFKINPKILDVAKYPVGLESRVKAITTLLSSGTKGVIKFGIYGMGGLGKTTLAKAVFNQLVRGRRFKGSCFLANVREDSGTSKGLVSLQQQLINDVLNNSTIKVEIPNVAQGIIYIRERICSAKILVLIDDIYDLEQYESLAGPFASGSVVIITTRDEEILDKVGVEPKYRYMLKELDDAQSRELFIKYAFGKAEPPKNLLALSDDILGLAGGLPLALQVFGSHLLTKKEVGWKSYIKTLQQHPNSTIEQKLAISLDALESDDRMLKEMFIDIACFFIGWKKEKAVKVLDTYYSYPDDKMETLTKRCLLTMNSSDKLEMHDLLRDVGRNVARNNAPDEPGKYSRLWLPEDIGNVLENHMGTVAIEGIIPYDLYDQVALEGKSFTTETFKWMSKLRFLYFSDVNLTGSFEKIFEDLRVLFWRGFPLKSLPSDFYPKKLVILELKHSKIRTMWDLNMGSHVFGKLKTLNMSFSQDLVTTPDFITLPCLEILNLEGCKSLEEVDISIGSLVRLDSLYLQGCKKLRSLPDTICNLRALKVLSISQCSSLEALPIQLGNIKSLTKLYADSLTVSMLPDSIGNLSKIVELNLRNNKKLEILPGTICNLRSLEILDIGSCSSLKALPTAIGNIETLKKINGSGLTVSKLPDSIGSLTKLVKLLLGDNKKLETLPDTICNLGSLEILQIRCKRLETLPDQLWKITSLRELDAMGATMLKKLPDIGSSQNALSLQDLDLCRSGITALPSGFSQLSNLEKLDLSECKHLLFIPKLPPNLKHIWAGYCGSLERIPNLSNLKHLETLALTNCRGLTQIRGLEELTALRQLYLEGCSGLTEIGSLEQLTSITGLGLGGLSFAYNLTKPLFQLYSEFGRSISVEITNWESDCDWITEAPYWTSESSESTTEPTTVYAQLLPNQSHNFMGIILCFGSFLVEEDDIIERFDYSVKNTTSGFMWTGRVLIPSRESYSKMVIVPKSIFSITDDDHSIEFTAENNVKNLGIHLLYNTVTKMIEDFAKKHVIS